MRRRHLLAASLATASLSLLGCTGAPPGLHGRLIVLRHADKTGTMLSAAGRARAAALPAAVADLEIDAVYCTPRQRNIDTATPIARARGLAVTPLRSEGAGPKLLAAHPGETVVWVGNQENLGLLYMSLGVPAKPPVQYGEVHVVTFPKGGGRPVIERRHYGV